MGLIDGIDSVGFGIFVAEACWWYGRTLRVSSV